MPKTTIQIGMETQQKLKRIGSMEDTYDTLIRRLIEEHEQMKKRELFVETQHEIARKGRFTVLE